MGLWIGANWKILGGYQGERVYSFLKTEPSFWEKDDTILKRIWESSENIDLKDHFFH